MQPPPTPDVILMDLLRSYKSDANSGEWGTHPAVPPEVGACARIPNACMCLQVTVKPTYTTLQECVDAWGNTSSRLCILRASETIYIALKHDRRGNRGGHPANLSDLEAIIHLPVQAANTGELFPLDYQVRSIVACAAAEAAEPYVTLHRSHRRSEENDATTFDAFTVPCPSAMNVLLLALRKCEMPGERLLKMPECSMP